MSVRDGHANPAETCRAFHTAVIRAGAKVHTNCDVMGISRGENGFAVKTSSMGTLHAEQIVNCAGAWAGQISKMAGDELPIEPVGASVLVTARMQRLLSTSVAIQGRKLWFNQARNGTFLICGGYYSYVDMKEGLTHMNIHELQACVRVANDLFEIADDLTIVRSWAGLEGETPDHYPIIGYSKKIPGFMHICGFSKHGFALSPMVGCVASAILQGKTPVIGAQGFEADRFNADKK